MAFTYVLSTSVGQIRLLIMDIDPTPGRYLFEDADLTAFLLMESSRVKRAAALALETMASNEAFVQKAITLLDLTTNGPAVAASLMARAKTLREQDKVDEMNDGDTPGFTIAEWPLGPASIRGYVDRLYRGGF